VKSRLSKGLRSSRSKRNRNARRRSLRLEALEDRRLLTLGLPIGGGVGGGGGIITPPPDDGVPGDGGAEEDLGYVSGQLIVGFDVDTTPAQREQILENKNATVIQSFPNLHAVVVTYPTLTANVPEQAEQWSDIFGVRYAEPNYIGQLLATPNDFYYPQMWGLNNTGVLPLSTPDADIDAAEAWDIFTGTSDAVVAVVDSGVEYTHEDLQSNMWRNPGEIPNDQIDNDGNGYIDDVFGVDALNRTGDPLDDYGHGTHVAGTIGASTNNTIGVAGINWDSSLMAVKIGDGGGIPITAAVEGLEYVTEQKVEYGVNVVVSNHSYGFVFPSILHEDAIRQHIAADIVFVAAAGNDSYNNDVLPSYPTSYDLPGIISVAATDFNDQLAVYSNYGVESVDIGAPGGGGTGDVEDIISTYIPNIYSNLAGTSMAAPHVAGAVALLRGYAPSLTAPEAQAIILDTADPVPALDGIVATGARLNVHEALMGLTGFEVRGTVWSDIDGDGRLNGTETGIAGWTVYADFNTNGQMDVGEPSAVTDASGDYVLETFKGRGTYTIAQVPQARWTQTFPAGGTHTITVTSRSDVITNIDFGNRASGGNVHGFKWHDLDADGLYDSGEPLMEGIYFYADLDNSGTLALGEPAAISNEFGRFLIEDVPPGQVIIREVLTAGWAISYPSEGYHTVTVLPGETTPLIGFGNATAIPDFGDAPAPYPTLIANDGASHELLPGFFLGELIDGEDDGIPDANALGDDLDNLDDEDGVEILETMYAGTSVSAMVTVSTGVNPPGVLQGWIDFNGDGDWLDAGEQVVTDLVLSEGDNLVEFDVPEVVLPGTTYARWRYGYERGIGPSGAAGAGEVEDYEVVVLRNEPVAGDDFYTIEQDSADNVLDVLDNDFPSSTGVLWITDDIVMVSDPERATVTVAADRQSLLITPAEGVFSPPDVVFTYTISDQVGGGGRTDTATVTVTVESSMDVPVAIDDTVYIDPTDINIPIFVMDNDLPGALGVMELDSVGTPSHGTVFINDNATPGDGSDDFLVYEPDPTFTNIDEFQYTIANANGSGPESIGTVTIFNENITDQDIQIDMDVVDMVGNPIFEIVVGEEFQLVVSIQDARTSVPNDEWGVFSAYLDVLYDRMLISTNRDSTNRLGFDIEFGEFYTNGQKSDASLPGVLNESGAFQVFADPPAGLGQDEFEFFRVTFTADAVGTVDFMGNPADDPVNNVLFFDPDDALVPVEDINFGFTSLDIISPEEAEGSPLDVNRDGYISPWDALQIINSLNSDGSQFLGEGEPAGGRPNYRLDVNKDLLISPYDALLVINYLNVSGPGEGEAEGEPGSALAATMSVDPFGAPELLPESDILPDGLGSLSSLSNSQVDVAASLEVDAGQAANSVPDQVLMETEDWRLAIGEEVDSLATDQASGIDGNAWESLLRELSEDELEAWLDGEDL
jgi:subtilisin family serine protease